MCDPQQPAGTAQALAWLEAALGHLATVDAASLTAGEQAGVLRGLARAEAKQTAAHARVLAAFAAQGGQEDDGQGSVRAWLKWQTRITSGAAAGAVGWARRLASHPVVGEALAAGELSPSWARQLCDWSDRLPEHSRNDGDRILCAAAAGGATLADVGGLAEELYQRCAGPDDDRDGGFDDRYFRLGITFGGAGRAEGDLSAGCAAALAAVLDALGKKAGPEDVRTAGQRRHDALWEACRRLVAAEMVPGRAGQPTHIQVHMTLSQLRGLPGGSAAEAAWAAAQATQPGWLSGPDAEAAACDATVVPIVTGHVDWAALDQFTGLFLAICGHPAPPSGGSTGTGTPADAAAGSQAAEGVPARGADGGAAAERGAAEGTATAGQTPCRQDEAAGDADGPVAGDAAAGQTPAESEAAGARPTAGALARQGVGSGDADGPVAGDAPTAQLPAGAAAELADAAGLSEWGCSCGREPCPHGRPLSAATRARLQRALLALAAQALSGPGGLAAHLRHTLATGGLPDRPLASVSLPLDVGAATETIPAHLRRAVTARHRCCAFPGCAQPAPACDIHHLIPRSQGGKTALSNLVPACLFHHLIAIHRWGWTLRLNPDGTTTATSPDGTRVLHSHSPPRQAA